MLRFIAFHAYQFFLLIICMALVWIAIPFAIALLGAIFSDPSPLMALLFLWLLGGPFLAFLVASRLAGPMRARLRPTETLADGPASALSALTAFLLAGIVTALGFWWWLQYWPIGETRRFHQPWPPVQALAFSPDGNSFASGCRDPDGVVIWDIASGAKRQLFQTGDVVNQLAFSPEGKHLLSLTVSGTVTIWDLSTGMRIQQFTSSKPFIGSACWCADSRRIVCGISDGTAKLYDCRTGQELHRFQGVPSADYRSSVACSEDGQRLLYAGSALILWDLRTGRELGRFKHDNHEISTAALSRDGHLIASEDCYTVQVRDAITGKIVLQTEHHWPRLALAEDGKRLITGDGVVWDIATGKELQRISLAGRGPIWAMAISADGHYVLTSGKAMSDILLWRLRS